MTRSFLNLSPKECREVYPAIFNNAEELYSTAELLAQSGFYGKAISHLILGTEEYIKGFLLFLESKQFELRKFKSVASVFKHHKPRHYLVRDIYSVWIVSKALFAIPQKSNRVEAILQLVQTAITIIPAVDHFHWWNEADLLKQRGLYVDFNDTLITPSQLTAVHYQEALQWTLSIRGETNHLTNMLNNLSPRSLKLFRQTFQEADFGLLISESVSATK